MLNSNKLALSLLLCGISSISFASASGCYLDIRNSRGAPLILKEVIGHITGYINYPQGTYFPITKPNTPGTPIYVGLGNYYEGGSVTLTFADSTDENKKIRLNVNPKTGGNCAPVAYESSFPFKTRPVNPYADRSETEISPNG